MRVTETGILGIIAEAVVVPIARSARVVTSRRTPETTRTRRWRFFEPDGVFGARYILVLSSLWSLWVDCTSWQKKAYRQNGNKTHIDSLSLSAKAEGSTTGARTRTPRMMGMFYFLREAVKLLLGSSFVLRELGAGERWTGRCRRAQRRAARPTDRSRRGHRSSGVRPLQREERSRATIRRGAMRVEIPR